MTRKSKREIQRSLDEMTDDRPDGDPLDISDPIPLDELVDDARDALPDEKVQRLEALKAQLEEQGLYVDDTEPAHDREMSGAYKEALTLVYGEAAECRLQKRGL